jgi:hypothetical protein
MLFNGGARKQKLRPVARKITYCGRFKFSVGNTKRSIRSESCEISAPKRFG